MTLPPSIPVILKTHTLKPSNSPSHHSPLTPSIPVILKTHTLKPSNSPSPHSHHYHHQYLSFWRHIHLNLAIHRHLTLTTTPHQYLSFWRHTLKPSNSSSHHSPLPPSIPVILKTHTLKPSNSPSPHSHHYHHQYLSFWRHIHLNLAIHRHLTLTTTPINTCHSEDTYT